MNMKHKITTILCTKVLMFQFKHDYDVVIAHGPGCPDGATSAWCYWRKLPSNYRKELSKHKGFYSKPDSQSSKQGFIHPNSPDGALELQKKGYPVVFVFCQPNTSVPKELIANKRVLILDLDLGNGLVPVVSSAKHTTLVDHHDSSLITLNKYKAMLTEKFASYVNVSKSQSGATLTWALINKTEIPPFLQIIRIGDNWQWHESPELHSKSVLKALHNNRCFRSFPDIESTYMHWDEQFVSNVRLGKDLLDCELVIAKKTAKQCDLGFIQTNDNVLYNVAYVQANVQHSEIGSLMKFYAQQRFNVPIHFCATWKYVSYRGLVSVSLRNTDTNLDLSFIARNIKGLNNSGGGGHSDASSFSFYGLENFHRFILKSSPIHNNYIEEDDF